MTTFDEREKQFEAKFANDQELKFKIEARRDKIVGTWAAGKLGKTGGDIEAYASTVVRADLKEPGDQDVFEKLRADLPEGDVSDDEIRAEMDKALAQAEDELGPK
ncbi:MAG: DUF1476 domain-containing protein [Pseudomonadota bacterium]